MKEGACLMKNNIMIQTIVDRVFPDVPDQGVRNFFMAVEWM